MNPPRMEGELRVEAVEDVLTMAVPEGLADSDPRIAQMAYVKSVEYVVGQFRHLPESERPTIRFGRIDTLITGDVERAAQFQPAHDCQECREGTQRTVDFLRNNPGRAIVMANIFYTTEI